MHAEPIPNQNACTTHRGSSARRALGELAPNAIASLQRPWVVDHGPSPLKQGHSPSLAQDENACSSIKLAHRPSGRKRLIDQVEDSGGHQDAKRHMASTRTCLRIATHLPRRATKQVPTASRPLSFPVECNPSSTAMRAETLRLRLRLALYKVKTNQTDVPLSRLEISEILHRKPAESAGASAHKVETTAVSVADGIGSRAMDTLISEARPAMRRTVAACNVDSGGPQQFAASVGSGPAIDRLDDPASGDDSDSLTSSMIQERAADALMKLTRST